MTPMTSLGCLMPQNDKKHWTNAQNRRETDPSSLQRKLLANEHTGRRFALLKIPRSRPRFYPGEERSQLMTWDQLQNQYISDDCLKYNADGVLRYFDKELPVEISFLETSCALTEGNGRGGLKHAILLGTDDPGSAPCSPVNSVI